MFVPQPSPEGYGVDNGTKIVGVPPIVMMVDVTLAIVDEVGPPQAGIQLLKC